LCPVVVTHMYSRPFSLNSYGVYPARWPKISMASSYKQGGGVARRVGTEQTGEESSESDGETEPAKSFHRRLSTNREIKCAVSFVCRICIDHSAAGSVLWLE